MKNNIISRVCPSNERTLRIWLVFYSVTSFVNVTCMPFLNYNITATFQMFDLENEGPRHRWFGDGIKPLVATQTQVKNPSSPLRLYGTISKRVKCFAFFTLTIKVKIMDQFADVCRHNVPGRHTNESQDCVSNFSLLWSSGKYSKQLPLQCQAVSVPVTFRYGHTDNRTYGRSHCIVVYTVQHRWDGVKVLKMRANFEFHALQSTRRDK